MSETNSKPVQRRPRAFVDARIAVANAARRPLAALAAAAVIFGVAACGKSDEALAPDERVVASAQAGPTTSTAAATTPGSSTTPGTTTPGTTTPGTTTPGTTTTPGAQKGGPGSAAKTSAAAKGKDGKTTSNTKTTSKGETTSKGTTTPAGKTAPADDPPPSPGQGPTGAEDPPGPNPPIDCLKKAGLTNPEKRAQGLWAAMTDGEDIVVDGPYDSAKEVQKSADSLRGVTRAEPAGKYMVSASLQADVGAKVDEVVRCLREKS